MNRCPRGVTPLAVLDLAGAALVLAATVTATLLAPTMDASRAALLLVAGAAGVPFAFLMLVAGIGLLRLRSYGRQTQIVLAAAAVPLVPFGTFFALLVLAYMLKPGARALFSRKHDASPSEDGSLAATAEPDGDLLMAGTIVGGATVIVAAVTLVAVVAVPGVRERRKVAAETAALRDIRAVIAAETAYAAANGGRFDRLECLAEPLDCLPASAPPRAAFLASSVLGPETTRGYVFSFHPGPPPRWEDENPGLSPSSMTTYAYVAAPRSGEAAGRWFCADGSGRLCASTPADAPSAVNGVCPLDCVSLP